MQPVRIEGGVPFGAPPGWDPATDGDCGVLFVRRELHPTPGGAGEGFQVQCISAWQPTQEELLAILSGGTIYLRCVGGQPPVSIWAEEAPPEDDNPYAAPPPGTAP